MKLADIKSSGYDDLAATIADVLSSRSGSLVFGISGAQGSGKSTFAKMLVKKLERDHSESVALLSLDDFYLSRADRIELANRVHPLLSTRGVPGTHDAVLMRSALDHLLAGEAVDTPLFDKSADDRASGSQRLGPARIIICEGWCWGAAPEPEARLQLPCNQLEIDKDSMGLWRNWVNERLGLYQSLFANQSLLFFAAPSFDAVLEWRWQQEQDLGASAQGDQIMGKDQIREFIAYYQRLSTWMLEEMPGRADVTVSLNADHSVDQIHFSEDSGAVQ